ncbi:MAG: rod shape-determining protein RodA [Gemmatimonadales bacterium]|nr:rod shape-determining protein RodA [Gemmatimonadales bacterium]
MMRVASRGGIDRQLVWAVLALTTFGVLMVYSAGQTDVPSVARGAWTRQLGWAAIGIVGAAIVFRMNFRILEWAAPGLYAFSLLLLVLTLLVGTGAGSAASSKSWLSIGGIRIGQPVELAKIATILLLARYLSSLRDPPTSLRQLVTPGLIAGVPFLLVMRQPDLGSAIVFVGILFAMLYWAGVAPRLLLLLASPAVSLLLAASPSWWVAWMLLLFLLLVLWRSYVAEGVLIYVVNSAMGVVAIVVWNRLKDYQRQRLITFLNPESDPIHAGYQAIQSKVAIGSGGLFGNGFLNGPQKRLAFLPEQYTDFIFAVVGEELGFAGVLVALALFLWLFFTLLRIARRATDPFSSLVVFGVLGLFFTHLFENIGMTINVMPITGIPLPFFSYGGSFLLAASLSIGLALRVAWDSRLSGYADG